MSIDFSGYDQALTQEGIDPEQAGKLLNFARKTGMGADRANLPFQPMATSPTQPNPNPNVPRGSAMLPTGEQPKAQPLVNFGGSGQSTTPYLRSPEPSSMAGPADSGGGPLNFGGSQTAKAPSLQDRYNAVQDPQAPTPAKFTWGRLLKAIGVGALGGTKAGMAQYEKPNTDAQQQFEDQQAAADRQRKDIAGEAGVGREEAETREADQRTRDLQNPRTPAATEKLTPEEGAIHDLMTGENGQPRVNPQTQKPYTYMEAYTVARQAGQSGGGEGKPGEMKPFTVPGSSAPVMAYQQGTKLLTRDGQELPAGAVPFEKPERSPYSATPSDVEDTVRAIQAGESSPVLTDYSFRDRTAIAAGLHKAGFNQAQAQQDYKATQRYLASLNGAQQLRLRQAVDQVSETIPQIQRAYDKLAAQAPRSGFKIINKGAMAAMKQLPGEAGSAAQQLDSLIADVTSELGTVYKGGNSSTDESLKLAAANLSSDWNDETFKDAMKRIKESIAIRNNSLRAPKVEGVSENSPYTPPTASPLGNSGGATGGGFADWKAKQGK